jgi:hypothetical protein
MLKTCYKNIDLADTLCYKVGIVEQALGLGG